MTAILRQVTIRGRVQGVGYRVWVAQTAESYGLDGWVRNRRDGSVEALFAGAEVTVADMIAKCHHGPSASRVDAVAVEEAGAELLAQRGAGERFSILPTV
ncbi:acylphosphatase [Rhodopseudomonas sp. HC1]|uniref:acylphosphatase n=1 Tax=Rhodopseudomonas infernalis TaxID=2897386 RepID=UPI001EE8C379|nr:acylphosphatase [Rhodopseudomonas infernalis]MCG6206100.1 acylphosphatase [Rhodopseudomonas infernalis]